jgi:hypothetical protein
MASKTGKIILKGILYVTGIIILIVIGILLTGYISIDNGTESLLQDNLEYFKTNVMVGLFNEIDLNFPITEEILIQKIINGTATPDDFIISVINTNLKLAVQSAYGTEFTLPAYLNFIPFLCYFTAGVLGLFFLIFLINNIKEKKRKSKSNKLTFSSIYQSALLTIVFIFTLIPFFSPIIDQGINDQNFSVYNEEWNGCSTFKETIELMGYEVMPIQSSLSATERIEQLNNLNLLGKNVLLVMLGPNKFYNPIYEIPFFVDFFKRGNSLLLCHDHGSTYELLWEIFASNIMDLSAINNTPATIFADGYLMDNKSFDTNPLFPVITKDQFNDNASIFTRGVDRVILSKATAAAGGPLIDFFGWNVIARTSDVHSFVDKNFDGRYDYKFTINNLTYYNDAIDINFIYEIMLQYYNSKGTAMPTEIAEFWNVTDGHLPLGYPFTPAVFLSKDTGNFRIFVSSDASLWNNQLITHPKYDNLQLAMNVINWLTRQDQGNIPPQWVIAIDEAHIRPEDTNDMTSAGIFGLIMRYIIQLSTNPITAWIYPLLAVVLLRKFLPKKGKEEEKKEIEKQEKKEDKLRFRTSSFFARKINMYHKKSRYRKAILLLYRRLERKLHAQLGDKQITPSNVVELVQAKDPNVSKNKLQRIAKFIKLISQLKAGKKNIKDKDRFYKFELTHVNSK